MDPILVIIREAESVLRGLPTTPCELKSSLVDILISVYQLRPLLVDATRISDGKLVYIKEVETGDMESRIAVMLSALDDTTNHSVPILDTFVDNADESISYVVMPFLRLSDNPPFETVGEVVDFTDQILEVC
jgi:hypothetical protein